MHSADNKGMQKAWATWDTDLPWLTFTYLKRLILL